jgi:hypothetical protein
MPADYGSTVDYEAGITVQIYHTPPTCPLQQQPNTSIAGLPAVYTPVLYHVWTAPGVQGGFARDWLRFDCGHVSGL